MRLVVNCWESQGRRRAVSLPPMMGNEKMAKDLRAAIKSARSGDQSGVVWQASPSDGTGGPQVVVRNGAIAFVVIAAVAAGLFAASTSAALLVWGLGTFVIAGFGFEWYRRSTVVQVTGDGHLVRMSPFRTVDVSLRSYRRVTVKVDRDQDGMDHAI